VPPKRRVGESLWKGANRSQPDPLSRRCGYRECHPGWLSLTFINRGPPTKLGKVIRGAPDFPAPALVLPNGARLWKRAAALKWFEKNPRRAYRKADRGAARRRLSP
jgi:hypothetical protein